MSYFAVLTRIFLQRIGNKQKKFDPNTVFILVICGVFNINKECGVILLRSSQILEEVGGGGGLRK